jgi:transposase-like protein
VSRARLIITAVVVEGRSQTDVARTYGVAESWVSRLVARYRTEGDAAFEPRSRGPVTRPDATPPETVELVLALRRQLTTAGLDAGADPIHATTGQLIRTLTIDPQRRYHGTGKPAGGPRRPYGPRKTKSPNP